jgi:uncharacterized damage-inducible protein DinB
MTQRDIESLLGNALDTFRAFDNLTVEISGNNQQSFPTSIWQILNHLIGWQAYQLSRLKGVVPGKLIDESETWLEEVSPENEAVLAAAVETFKGQLADMRAEATRLPAAEEERVSKLGIILEVGLHLSFHLGEVVLMRRVQGSYPMPHQMKAFLQT